MKKKTIVAKMLSMVLAAGMILSLAACGQKPASKEESKTPASESTVKESTPASESTPVASEEATGELTYPLDTDVKLTLWAGSSIPLASTITKVEDSPAHMALIERTGVDIEYEFLAAGAKVGEAYNLLWVEKEKPDLIFHNITTAAATTLYEDGLIWDLTDYVEEYAPDFWAYMNQPENLELLEELKSNDGRILRIPGLVESDYNLIYQGFIIRKDWLDACGLDMPVTIADWEEVLAAFKEKYNAGIVFDSTTTICGTGFIASGFDALGFVPWTLPSVKDGKVTYAPLEPEYKEMMETIVKWWDNEWIDADSATLDMNGVRTKAMNNEAGITVVPMSQFTNIIADAEAEGNGAEWVALCSPRVAEGAPTSYIGHSSPSRLMSTGSAIIPSSSSEEEMKTALQLVNYAFTEEGEMFINFGEEGVTYTMVDGKPQFTDLVKNDPDGLNEAAKKYSLKGGSFVGVQKADLVAAKNKDVVADAPNVWSENNNGKACMLPNGVVYTEEERETRNTYGSAIRTYNSEQTFKFLTGERDMSEWDTFLEELRGMGVDEYMAATQSAYERYINR